MKRDSMVFYRSFYEAVSDLPDEERLACLDAVIRYGLDGTETREGVAGVVLKIAKPIIDKNNERYMNGHKGGRPKTTPEPPRNHPETTPEPNVNVNVNDNENENVKKRARAKSFDYEDQRSYNYNELERKLMGRTR